MTDTRKTKCGYCGAKFVGVEAVMRHVLDTEECRQALELVEDG